MIEVLDNLFRYGAVMVCMLMIALAMRDARAQLARRLSIALSVTTASYLLSSAPGMAGALGTLISLFIALGMLTPLPLWLFSLSMFDDSFRLTKFHWLVVGLFMVNSAAHFVGFYALYGGMPAMSPAAFHGAMIGVGLAFNMMNIIGSVLKLAMIGHMVWHAWRGRGEDLLEARRRFRSIFVVAGSVITIGVLFLLSIGSNLSPVEALMAELVQAGAIFVIVSYLLWHLIRIDSDWLMGDPGETPVSVETHCELSPADQHDLDVINGLGLGAMLVSGLTITKLAHDTHIPEHRLRHLINQHLGYRNFSDFLNHHRIEAAKDRLGDTEIRHTPVLTIAMDLGYGSLGPFNRAFKERTGQTPTEYRNQILSSEWVAAQ